jgi:Fe2+ or Zn2+ uptake regulation protein
MLFLYKNILINIDNMDNQDKNMLYQAITEYGKYTDNQNKVLCALVDNAVDNLVYVSVTKFHKQTKVLKPTIYAALNVLQIDGIIEKDQNNKGLFKISQDKINFIIKSYLKKK